MMKTFLAGIQLPVNPFEDITFSSTINVKEYDIISFGEVVKMGNRKAIELVIKSLLTNKNYPFLAVKNPLPAIDYLNKLYALLNSKEPVRLIITGDMTDINFLCVITEFQHTQKFGEEGEYYYSLTLKEYLEPKAKKVVLIPASTSSNKSSTAKVSSVKPTRTQKKPVSTTYTVRKGDCLWNIAKIFYGDGSKYPVIIAANPKIRNNAISPNMVLTIPGVTSAAYQLNASKSKHTKTSSAAKPTATATVNAGVLAASQLSALTATQYFNAGTKDDPVTVHYSSSGEIHGGGGGSW